MRYLLLLVVLTATACPPQDEKEISKNFFQNWKHSYEDKVEDGTAFRPSNHKFPPSRGRKGFEFKSDGSFTAYMIAPTDGYDIKPGKWTRVGKDILELDFDDEKMPNQKMKIISVTSEMLVVKEVNESGYN